MDPARQLTVAADPAVQQVAVATACERAARRWPFLQWAAISETPASATWIVRVGVIPRAIQDGQGNTFQGAEVQLQHVVGVGGAPRVLGLGPELELLYEAFQPQPGPADAATMAADLTRALERQLGTLLESAEFVSFVRQIPLGGRITVDPSGQRLLVLMDPGSLKAEPQTLLEARLSIPGHTPCLMHLEIAREIVEESDLDGCIQARVTWCNAPEITAVPTWWDPQLSGLVESSERVQVFMREYRPSYYEAADESGIVEGATAARPLRCAAGRTP